MNTYLVAYYGSVVPTFSYAETLKEARLYALILLNSQHCRRDDVLSIVDVAKDCVVYYGKRDELIAKFEADGQPIAVTRPARIPLLRPFLNWIGFKLAGPTVW